MCSLSSIILIGLVAAVYIYQKVKSVFCFFQRCV